MNFTKAQKEVYAMLIENTGKHMLDSGSAYGRNWQRNKSKTIEDLNHKQLQQIHKQKRNQVLDRLVRKIHKLSKHI